MATVAQFNAAALNLSNATLSVASLSAGSGGISTTSGDLQTISGDLVLSDGINVIRVRKPASITSTRLVLFPDAAGTIALTSDMPTTIVGITGTIAQFNTSVTDADLATLAGTETFSNKTISAPIISGAASFTSATGPTSAGTSPGSTSLITLADGNARFAPMNGFASSATFSTGNNGILYFGSYGITNAGNRLFGEYVFNVAANTAVELSPVLDLNTVDNWRGMTFEFDPLVDSASVDYTAHGFHTNAGPRVFQTSLSSGDKFYFDVGYISFTVSGSITVVAGDTISDAAGASAIVQTGTTGTTMTIRSMNGTRNFTNGSAVSVNGSGAGVTVATVTGTRMSSGNTDFILIHRGYLTGSTGGMVIWNNTSNARALRLRISR